VQKSLELDTGFKKRFWEGHGFTDAEKLHRQPGYGKGTASAVPLTAAKNAGFSP
jgi:hypothetical protein